MLPGREPGRAKGETGGDEGLRGEETKGFEDERVGADRVGGLSSCETAGGRGDPGVSMCCSSS